MTVAEAIIERLENIAAVTALVGTRIYNKRLPQNGTLPAIRVDRVSELKFMHLRGNVELYRCRVQVDAVSSERGAPDGDPVAQAYDVDAAAEGNGHGSGLLGWRGTVGSPGVRIEAIYPAGVQDDYEGEELRLFKVMRDYWVWIAQ